jgi:lipoyl(octanoyl) transferase
LRERILESGGPETLLFCEHDPVITLGRRARPEHLLLPQAELAARGIQVCRASRGGEVTYHGPGQLVCYPVVRLRRGVLAHVEGMAEAVIALLGRFGITGEWRRTLPGVWVGSEKICAFGVQVRRGVSVHGLALNVSTDLLAFSTIVPCGLPRARVTSMAQLLGQVAPPLAELAAELARLLARAFRLDLAPAPAPSSEIWPPPGVPPAKVIHSPSAQAPEDLLRPDRFQLQNGKPDR